MVDTQIRYRHTQFGSTILYFLAPALLFFAVLMLAERNGFTILLFVLFALITISFTSMTVEVNNRAVVVRMGPGLLRFRFPLDSICNCRVIDNPPMSGWGIHWAFPGWLYNVAGRQAVELDRNESSPVRIGSDEPDRLAAAIEDALMAYKAH